MITVSYIVPVFNGERFVDACAASLAAQLRPGDEAIFVDDGSTDGTAERLSALRKEYSGIQIIRQENRGIGGARNTGMAYARGTYLAFLDCDDTLADGAVLRLADRAAELGEPDVLLFEAAIDNELAEGEAPENLTRQDAYRPRSTIRNVLSGREMFLRLNEDGAYRHPAWLGWYRREYMERENIRFREKVYYEDVIFKAETLLRAETAGMLAEPVYRRRIQAGSVMTERKTYFHARSAWMVQLGLRNLAWGRDADTVRWLDGQADQLERMALEIYGSLSEEEIREGESRNPDGLLMRSAGPRTARAGLPAAPASGSRKVRETAGEAESRKEKFQPESPRISVVLPVYNGERTLPETLKDLAGQTLNNFEMIFVDDGSTDGTEALLKKAAERDPRIRAIRQENRYAGAARNTGMDAAKGEYLLFLDGDDRFDPHLLAHALERARETEAQAVLFNADAWDETTGSRMEAAYLRPCDGLPEGVFAATEAKSRIFVNVTPWTKMFRRDYIEGLGIRFREQYSCNDLTFIMTALACAKLIAALPETLVHYRVGGQGSNLSARRDMHPLDVYDAFEAARREMEKRGVFGEFRAAFGAKAMESMLRSMDTFRSLDSARVLYERLRNGGWDTLAADAVSAEDMNMPRGEEILNRCRRMREKDFDTFMLDCMKHASAEGPAGGSREIRELRNSYAYRIGSKITWAPHQAKVMLQRLRRKG